MIGPPGTGKTLLAKRLPTILPPLTPAESLETTRIYSAMGLLRRRPAADGGAARSARRTTPSATPAWSAAAARPQPGEISLAHKGVLFLDEMPEFNRKTLEVLRQPLEEGKVTISRALRSTHLPGRLHPGGGDEPLPLRLPLRPAPRLQVHAAAGREVPEPDLRPAAGPHRPARRGAGRPVHPARRDAPRRHLGRVPRPGADRRAPARRERFGHARRRGSTAG